MPIRFFTLLLLLAAPLHAQFDSTSLAGRVLSRRQVLLENHPSIGKLSNDSLLGFDSWEFMAMDDSYLTSMVGLLAAGLGRIETICAERNAWDNGEEAINAMLAGITDSMEAERWADLMEHAAHVVVAKRPPGIVAPAEALRERFQAVLSRVTPEQRAIFEGAQENSGAAMCLGLRLVFEDLAREAPSVAGPLIRSVMATEGPASK